MPGPGRRRVTGEICFLQFWPAVETQRLENAFAGHLFVDEIGDRTSEMTRHWKETDPEVPLIGCADMLAVK